ncbi:GDP-mannose pyrophosphatase NudK [Pseudomonas protegens]|uniref:GDP-mannose pyrophosphatase n=1 Tax=Pseudomonas protegens TaxID=380021 RepID=A0A7G7XCT1_9PSED|nr:GDP-mannose pyrophosphatase NudK [Pseudomonas protegens]QNH77776.1 GDP-mannose pyrophosphatase NudK [Pseudomonas protegens]QNL06972.1 GDP-mannose pyrophosphatase NudK [Pseudomonas protegens]
MSEEKIRITAEQTLSDNWYVLKKYSFELRRRDGSWQAQEREVYDRGNGATILLYNLERRTVLLTRQFRMPAFVNDHSGYLIETAAGLLDNASPEVRIRQEAQEETGCRVGEVQKVFDAFMSPGSVTERVHFFIGHYQAEDRIDEGGGLEHEGEDIEVLELDIDQALDMIKSGEIADGKTIMLLQYLQLHVLKPRSLTVLVAGPYRSGTGDDPLLLARNVEAMEQCAAQVLAAGHFPLLGEWVALPMTRLAGSRAVGDEVYNQRFHAYAERLLQRCDALLRIGGPSAGCDAMVQIAQKLGLSIYHQVQQLPTVIPRPGQD